MLLPSRPPFLLAPDAEKDSAPSPDRVPPPASADNNAGKLAGEIIATRAYDIWNKKGRPLDTDLQNWLEAEAELHQIKALAQQLVETNHSLQEALTESKRRQESLRQAEQRFHSIFDNAIEGIFQTTPEGGFITANPALARMLGYESPEELMTGISDIGRQLYVSPERRMVFQKQLRELGRIQNYEAQVYRKDGRIIWLSLTARAVRDDQGRLCYFEGMMEDVSERKRAEESLKNSENLYSSLVETLPVCIFCKDLHGRYTFANKAFCAWLKLPLEQIIGKTALDLYPADLAHRRIRDDQQVLETGKVLVTVEEHPQAADDRQYLQIYKMPLFDSPGAAVGLQGAFWDITPRKRAEAELSRTEAEFHVARTIQQRLFPKSTPRISGMDIEAATFGFDIGGASYPAEAIGGDYYDFIPLPDGSLGIAIGDVSGHGVGPALLMAETRAFLRAFAQTHADVSTILGLVNRVLVPDVEEDRFITLLLAKLDPRTRSFVYASAGHPTGYILDAAGNVKRTLPSTSVPLGIMSDVAFLSSDEIILDPGDNVLLITDGIVEARSPDGIPFGPQRPLDLVRTAHQQTATQIVAHLYHAVRAYSQDLPQYDDITAAIIKVAPVR